MPDTYTPLVHSEAALGFKAFPTPTSSASLHHHSHPNLPGLWSLHKIHEKLFLQSNKMISWAICDPLFPNMTFSNVFIFNLFERQSERERGRGRERGFSHLLIHSQTATNIEIETDRTQEPRTPSRRVQGPKHTNKELDGEQSYGDSSQRCHIKMSVSQAVA